MSKVCIVARHEIDLNRWNTLVQKYSGTSLYVQSWYLDALTHNGWSALILDDYRAVLPFYKKKKWGLAYVLPPLLCQRLGVIGEVDEAYRKLLYETLLQQGIKVDITSDGIPPRAVRIAKRKNHILKLEGSHADICQGYNRNARRNLVDFSQSGQRIEASVAIPEVCRFLSTHDPTGLIGKYQSAFEKLIHISIDKGCGHILIAKNEESWVSAAFYIEWNQRIYFLLCGSDSVGKKSNATYAIIDAILQKYAGRGFVFDFTGSGIPGVARRNLAFGAQTEEYWHARSNILQRIFSF